MSDNIGIWVDHQKAIIVFAGNDRSVKTVDSHVGSHPHFGGSQEGGGERKYEARFNQHLTRFYEDVIDQLGHPDAVFIFGPGEAKQQLEHQLTLHKELSSTSVETAPSDALTEPQIITKVRQHFDVGP